MRQFQSVSRLQRDWIPVYAGIQRNGRLLIHPNLLSTYGKIAIYCVDFFLTHKIFVCILTEKMKIVIRRGAFGHPA